MYQTRFQFEGMSLTPWFGLGGWAEVKNQF